MGATIRSAAVDDARGIAAVHVQSWQSGYRGLIPDDVLDGLSVDERETEWFGWLSGGAEDGFFVLVAEDAGAVVGFCSVKTQSNDAGAEAETSQVTGLYVEPGRWRRGVGAALMTAALDDLRRQGSIVVTLWMLNDNDQARSFYDAFGFTPDGAFKRDPARGETIEDGGPLQVRLRRSPP